MSSDGDKIYDKEQEIDEFLSQFDTSSEAAKAYFSSYFDNQINTCDEERKSSKDLSENIKESNQLNKKYEDYINSDYTADTSNAENIDVWSEKTDKDQEFDLKLIIEKIEKVLKSYNPYFPNDEITSKLEKYYEVIIDNGIYFPLLFPRDIIEESLIFLMINGKPVFATTVLTNKRSKEEKNEELILAYEEGVSYCEKYDIEIPSDWLWWLNYRYYKMYETTENIIYAERAGEWGHRALEAGVSADRLDGLGFYKPEKKAEKTTKQSSKNVTNQDVLLINRTISTPSSNTGKDYVDNFNYGYFFECADRLVKWSTGKETCGYTCFDLGPIDVTEAYHKRTDCCRYITLSALINDSNCDVALFMNRDLSRIHPNDKVFFEEINEWFNVGDKYEDTFEGGDLIYVYQSFLVTVKSENELKDFLKTLKSLTDARYPKTRFSYSLLGNESSSSEGCYIATYVYGSYDCPEVWVLRRFRDFTLKKTTIGRYFVKGYYAVSPTLVEKFGKKEWFNIFWKHKLDRLVLFLKGNGVADTCYND